MMCGNSYDYFSGTLDVQAEGQSLVFCKTDAIPIGQPESEVMRQPVLLGDFIEFIDWFYSKSTISCENSVTFWKALASSKLYDENLPAVFITLGEAMAYATARNGRLPTVFELAYGAFSSTFPLSPLPEGNVFNRRIDFEEEIFDTIFKLLSQTPLFSIPEWIDPSAGVWSSYAIKGLQRDKEIVRSQQCALMSISLEGSLVKAQTASFVQFWHRATNGLMSPMRQFVSFRLVHEW